ncbi:hypothetical protein LFL96_12255 [Paraburkholderia sp. D15]|uniref:hypothetical protein n=1 Tax=Paraburkholderia sp. D15 TaxID=2880218 RepID=UPI002479A738|nr:hypothetical protein [Paraburkholderia sp. D15]WGS48561.1 hypothetical protein LFL96_12255 [Paraburkholderia sp. D15]
MGETAVTGDMDEAAKIMANKSGKSSESIGAASGWRNRNGDGQQLERRDARQHHVTATS